MMSITTKPLYIDLELKKKIEFICDFAKTTSTIINGNIRKIYKTKLVYTK